MYGRATKLHWLPTTATEKKEMEKEEIEAQRTFVFRLRQGDALFEGALRKRERKNGRRREVEVRRLAAEGFLAPI